MISFREKPAASAERQAYYERIDCASLTPLWEVLGELVTPQPNSPCVPALWRVRLARRVPVRIHIAQVADCALSRGQQKSRRVRRNAHERQV
jgi:gentisate 1,2-dioxygenase